MMPPMSAASPAATAPTAPADAPPGAEYFRPPRGDVWLPAFAGFQFLCQLLLLTQWGGSIRLVLRIAIYVISLALLLVLRRVQRAGHPAGRAAAWVLVLLAFEMLHPLTNGVLSGAGQWGLYLAILGPLFWAPRLEIGVESVRRLVTLFWLFHTLSSIFGVLQVLFPGQFQPNLSTAIASIGRDYVTSMQITLDSGVQTFRPMGLTDIPGGAGPSGVYAALFSVGQLFATRKLWRRGVALGAMVVGMAAVYLSHVRVSVVMLAICLGSAGLVFLVRRGVRLIAGLVTAVVAMGALAYVWSVSTAGETVATRLETLTEDDPRQVYYRNRGHFLEYTLTELVPEYPLGAGLGRWGMVTSYLGSKDDPERGALWAEIQITGWVYDGGILMVLIYGTAVLLAVRQAMRIAVRARAASGDLWLWGTVLFAYDVGTLALTFSYAPFIGQSGMEFWLFNAALHGAAVSAGLVRPRRAKVV
jgi:hypothetical protein